MSTGDMKNNLKKLQKEADMVYYHEDLDYEGLAKGDPEAHLAILYHAFFEYGSNTHQYLTSLGYSISGKRGTPFIAVVFKIIRERDSALKLTLKVAQFMSKGFAERKIMLTTAILNYVRTNLKLSCSAKSNHRSKRKVNIKSENKRKVPELVCPDMSCIKHDHDVISDFHQDEIPIKEMHSTALNSVRQQPVGEPAVGNQGTQTASAPNANYAATRNANCLQLYPRTDHVAMLGSLPLEHGAGDGAMNIQHKLNQNAPSITRNLPHESGELMRRVSSLELQNQQLSLQLDEQSLIIKDLQQENELLRQKFETDHARLNAIEDALCKQEDLSAQVTELESVVQKFKESLFVKHPSAQYSPVCGIDLCKQLRNCQLESKTPDANGRTPVSLENSLSDITNESPINPTHLRSEKLFELVRDTRSLLGMDVNTPKASKSDVENDD